MGIVSGGDVWRERPQRCRQRKAEKDALMEKSRFLKKGIVPTHVDCLGITEEGLARAWSWPRSPSTMRPWGNILEEGSVPGRLSGRPFLGGARRAGEFLSWMNSPNSQAP